MHKAFVFKAWQEIEEIEGSFKSYSGKMNSSVASAASIYDLSFFCFAFLDSTHSIRLPGRQLKIAYRRANCPFNRMT
jgi:hypothetical protein